MNDSAFNRSLDALVRGDSVGGNDELAGFAAGLYRKEHDVMMPSTVKSSIAANLGLDTGAVPAGAAPISHRTARATANERDYARRPWSIAAAIVIAVSLALTGILQWGMQTGDDGEDNRFGLLSPAIPTVEATPAATPLAETRWLAPVSADECPANELVDPGERARLEQEQLSRFEGSPVRIDAPYGEVDADIAEKVVTRQRKMMSCQNSQQMLVLSVRSDQSVYEWNLDDDSEEAQKLNVDRMGRSKQLSGWLEYERGLTHEDLIHQVDDPSAEIGLIWEPDNAVRMADGRVALVPGWITTSAEDTPGLIGFVPVWMETDDGRWLLDEELYFCIGDCEGYWAERASVLFPDASPPGSPAATPLPECLVSEAFKPDYEIDAAGPVNLRARPGIQSVDPIIALPVDSQVMYLCESEPTTNPEVDGIAEGQLWLKVRTERGEEGWIREINLKPISDSTPPIPSLTPTG